LCYNIILASFQALAILGPAIGFMVGAATLVIWGDIDKIPFEQYVVLLGKCHNFD
jgi:hypothetical protein